MLLAKSDTPKDAERKKTKTHSLEEAFLKITGHDIREEKVSSKDRFRARARRFR